jgi:hypothetical protein
MLTVSAVAPAVTASWCATFDGSFADVPSVVCWTVKDGLATAEAGTAHISARVTSEKRRIIVFGPTRAGAPQA